MQKQDEITTIYGYKTRVELLAFRCLFRVTFVVILLVLVVVIFLIPLPAKAEKHKQSG